MNPAIPVNPEIEDIVDLARYPLDRPGADKWIELIERCRRALTTTGMFELPGFIQPAVLAATVTDLLPKMLADSYEQRRRHNIYFVDSVEGLAADHPALAKIDTVNHTLCGDQLAHSALTTLYEWQPFRVFVAATMQLPELHLMDDALARINVLSYRPGESLNWHFDRSEYTVTLLLQAATDGGVFEYRSNLRSDDDPNYDGVGRLVAGTDPEVSTVEVTPGALNVFTGRNTAHRVTTVGGTDERMIAVLSYYDRPGVRFTDTESRGFYGRTATESALAER